MVEKSNKFSRFLQELKRRKTDRVIVVYAATAFIILQLTDILSSPLSLPEWTTTFVIVLLAIGFPVTAILAWIFDITPDGIERTKPYNDKKKHGKRSNIMIWKGSTLISVIVIIGLLLFNVFKGNLMGANIKNLEKSIAVLPFKNSTGDVNMNSISDGLTSFISCALSNVSIFRVLPSPYTYKYKDSNIPYRTIGKDLNVSLFISGELHEIRDSILVNVQLIIASKENVLWGNNYTIDPKMETYKRFTNDLITQIAKRLETPLSDKQKENITRRMTKIPEALVKAIDAKAISDVAKSYYFQGYEKFADMPDTENFKKAINLFDEAIRIDTNFAYAYAQRAITRSWAYLIGNRDPANIVKCREDIDKAKKIEPDSKEVQFAEGFYNYYCTHEYQKAIDHFNIAGELDPEDWQPPFFISLVYRRMANWDKAKELLKVLKVRPQNALILTNIGMTYDYLRDYNKALKFHNQAIKYAPGWTAGYINKIETIIRKNGNIRRARAVLSDAINNSGNSLFEMKIKLQLYDGNFIEALNQMKLCGSSELSSNGEVNLLFAQINGLLNNTKETKQYYNAALVSFKQELIGCRDSAKTYSNIGIAYAGLMEKDKAIESGKRGVAMETINILKSYERKENLAQIFTMLGLYDDAFRELEFLLKYNTCFSTNFLKIDPVWLPLRDKPEYKEFLIKYAKM